MQYIITFLEGIVSFISPCMLPMLPVYISYFAGDSGKKRRTIANAFMFVLGFTVVFCLMGLFAGALGSFLVKYQTALNLTCGALIIIFGLSCLDIVRLPFFKGTKGFGKKRGLWASFVFGIVYSVSLTPCIGAFLGSALMMASAQGTAAQGLTLLLCYSMGLGIPFLLSAVLIDRLSNAFTFIKSHYKVINTVCGIFLIVVGILMMLGLLNYLLAIFS